MLKFQMAQDLFVQSGGLELLAAYGIEAGDNPLVTFSKSKYPSKNGKLAPLGGMQPGTLVADGSSLRLFAGIGQPSFRTNRFTVESAMVHFAKGSKFPTWRLADLAIEHMGGSRPLLVYSVGRSWGRSVSLACPTLDPSEVIVSGESNVTFDILRTRQILSMVKDYQIKSISGLRYFIETFERSELSGKATERSEAKLRDSAGKLLGFTRKTPPERRSSTIEALMEGILDLPSTIDAASWSMASRILEREKDAKKQKERDDAALV